MISEEMIAAAAEAIEIVETHSSEDYARAAIAAVLPLIGEECAKIADKQAVNSVAGPDWHQSALWIADDIRAATKGGE